MFMSKKIDMLRIQELREITGLGMMDCKKALEETDGDIEKAIEFLRKKGAAVAAKRAGKRNSPRHHSCIYPSRKPHWRNA